MMLDAVQDIEEDIRGLDPRFGCVDQRLDSLDQHVGGVKTRLDKIDTTLQRLYDRRVEMGSLVKHFR